MREHVRHITTLSQQKIIDLTPGIYDDYDLLDVVDHFHENDDEIRAMATIELILRSPDYSDMVGYTDLFRDLVYYYQNENDCKAALRWAYAMLTFAAQHALADEWPVCHREAAYAYLCAGDLDTGLSLYARRLQAAPGDILTYNQMGITLPEYGLPDLALKALERGLTLKDDPEFEEWQEQLQNMHQELLDEIENERQSSKTDQVDPAVLDDIRSALELPVSAPHDPDQAESYLPPVERLIDSSSEGDQDLFEEILSQGLILAPELIRLAFDRSLEDSPAIGHAVTLLRELRPQMENEFSLISQWLDRADGNWQTGLLSGYIGKIGGFTTDELENFALDQERDDGLRIAAAEALAERAENLPEERESIIAFMETLLTRPEGNEAREETFLGFLVSIILDLDARELYPQIKAVFDEDRVDPSVVALADIHIKWEMELLPNPRERQDGLYLLLGCKSCKRKRFHFVQYILVDQNTLNRQSDNQPVQHSPFIMGREIVCPKCGARDRYELTTQASFSLMAPIDPAATLSKIQQGADPKEAYKPRPEVYFFRSEALGQPMHPFEALEEYEVLIATNPGDASLHIGLANILRILYRIERALEESRFALELAPNDPNAILMLALAEHDLGDRERARELYEKALALSTQPGPALPPDEREEYQKIAQDGLRAIERGRQSPWQPEVYNAYGDPLPAPGYKPSKKQTKGKRSRRKK